MCLARACHGWNSTQKPYTTVHKQYTKHLYWKHYLLQTNKLTGRNGLTTLFQVFTVWYGILCSFLVIITHECAARVCYYHQKAHSIPYHTVNTWNSVVNPSINTEEITEKCSFWVRAETERQPHRLAQTLTKTIWGRYRMYMPLDRVGLVHNAHNSFVVLLVHVLQTVNLTSRGVKSSTTPSQWNAE